MGCTWLLESMTSQQPYHSMDSTWRVHGCLSLQVIIVTSALMCSCDDGHPACVQVIISVQSSKYSQVHEHLARTSCAMRSV